MYTGLITVMSFLSHTLEIRSNSSVARIFVLGGALSPCYCFMKISIVWISCSDPGLLFVKIIREGSRPLCPPPLATRLCSNLHFAHFPSLTDEWWHWNPVVFFWVIWKLQHRHTVGFKVHGLPFVPNLRCMHPFHLVAWFRDNHFMTDALSLMHYT